jgi:serpin B
VYNQTGEENVKGGREMISQSRALVSGIAVVLVIIACFCGGAASQEKPASWVYDRGMLVAGNTEFALDLYGRLHGREGNLFLSPYSISSALAMTYAGASGNTAKQMKDVLRFDLDNERLHGAFGMLTRRLNEKGQEGAFEFNVANALWGQKSYRFLDSFLDMGKRHYDAGLNLVDFIGNPEGARRTINAWVEEKTKDRIKDLLESGAITRDTRLVLTNALYFKGMWASRFDTKNTEEGSFWLMPDTSVTAPMMHQTGDFGYMETETFQALELQYEGDGLSMVVLLPKEKDGLTELEQSLSAKALAEWLGGLKKQEVVVTLPRFRVTAEFTLNEILKAMGMADAFSPTVADFSGMTGKRELAISSVVHKAFVDVNEEGTEAAAATAVVMYFGDVAMPPVFRADHPFLFLIRDNESGSILGLGRLVNPQT